MAVTKTLIFDKVTVSGVDYTLHLTENAEVTIEPLTDVVDDGQTLVSAYDVSFSVDVYDTDALSGANIYVDASTDPQKTNIVFSGVSSAQTITITNVYVNAIKKFDSNRLAVNLSGTKRTVTLADATTES